MVPSGMELGGLVVMLMIYVINFIILTITLVVCLKQKSDDTEFYIPTHSVFILGLIIAAIVDFIILLLSNSTFAMRL
jgi:hypothetical protein